MLASVLPKIMNKKSLIVLFFISLLFPPPKTAVGSSVQEEVTRVTLVDDGYNRVYTPGVLPDSWKYPLKITRDKITEIFLFFDPAQQRLFKLKLAHKRILEIQEMCFEGKCQNLRFLMDEYREIMDELFGYLKKEKNRKLLNSFYASLPQHQRVIDALKKITGENDKEVRKLDSIFREYYKNIEAYWGLNQLRQFHFEMEKR